MFVKIVVPLAAVSAAVLLLTSCFGGDEESAPRMTSEPTSSAPTSATVTVKVTEPTTVPKGSEPVTVTWRADVPTTTEVGTDVLPKSAPAWKEEIAVCAALSFGSFTTANFQRSRPARRPRYFLGGPLST
jgi:hypothetical protein